jgi:transcriptional regulator with XRE-family HTH domain
MRDISLTVGPNELGNTRFGEIIYTFRLHSKLTKPKAAERIGVSTEYIRLIERGERTPALGTLLKILDIYGVSYEQKPKSQVVIDGNISVTFTSRIKGARHSLPNHQTRNELIGQIVSFLTIADDDTLRKIHSKLLRSMDAAS